MYLKRIDTTPKGLARTALIESILPKETLIKTMLTPKLNSMTPTLLKMLYAELEVYRQFPKTPLEDIEKAKKEVKTFDPRNHTSCFQGKAFKVKDNTWGDAELQDYRNAVGTFHHAEWGDATLLEIWGGDHFKDYPKMVKAAFKYGANINKTKPVLKFHINPLFMNKKSGKTKMTPEQKQYQEDMDLLLHKAMIYGVKGPKRRR